MYYELKKIEGELKVFKGGKESTIELLAEAILQESDHPERSERLVTIIETLEEFAQHIPEGESLKIIDC